MVMPVFVSLHRAPGLSDEEIAGYGPEVARNVHATFSQMLASTDSGFIATLYVADSAAWLEREVERLGFPHESINEVDIMHSAQALSAIVGAAA
jgi:hypothetical protein